jgi:hypothetical protein
MDEQTTSRSASGMLTDLLADAEGMKLFADAVMAAFVTKHGGSGTEYNLDTLGRLGAALDSYRYATDHMLGKPRLANRFRLIEFCAKHVTVDGPVLEFGVWSGTSINLLARLFPSSKIYGFDSFEGLPESWIGTGGKGQFSRDGELPKVRDNVQLIKGWFDHTLPGFLDDTKFDKISLLHVDCDLYSSTQTVFAHLHPKIAPGTIIVFDEYFNYPTWERHEFRAFQEYVRFRQVRYEYIGLVPSSQQVAVRILAM